MEVSAVYSPSSRCFTIFCRDITNKKAFHRALQESERRYRTLLDSVTDYIYSVSLDGGVPVSTYHGPGCAAITGYDQADFLRDPDLWMHMVYDEDRQLVTAQADAIQQQKNVFPVEHRIVRKDGSIRWVRNVPVLWHDERGRLVSYDGLVSDITERKLVEQALRDSEERYRTVLDTSPDGICIHRACRVLYVNAAGAELIGVRNAAELTGKSILDFLSDDSRQTVMDRLAQLQSGCAVLPSADLRLISLDGRVIEVETRAAAIRFDGEPAALSIIRDITEHRKVERAQAESERQLRTLMENSPDAVYRVDRDLRCLYVSPAIEIFTGLPPSVYQGRTVSEITIEPNLKTFIRETLQRVFQTGEVWETEYEFSSNQRKRTVVNWRLIPELSPEGRVQTVLSILRDITEHRKVEQDYRALFRTMTEGLAVHELIFNDRGDPVDYRFISVNPAFERMTGLNADDLVGRRVKEVLPQVEDSWITTYGDVVLTGKPVHFERYSKDLGKWFSVTAYKPAERQFATIVDDITERKRMEEQLRQSQKMEAIGILAGGVAHDFNNIVQAVVGNAHLLKKSVENEVGRLYLDEILSLSNRAADLTRGLLAFSRKQMISLKPLNLNAVVLQMGKMLPRLIGEDIEISVHLTPEPLIIEADEGQLHQVLLNLATNARDAMPKGGVLAITTEQVVRAFSDDGSEFPSAYALLTIRDTGCGIAQKDIDHIFEPFYTTKEIGKGTGLGLSVVYGIIKQHGGFVEVASSPPNGSAIQIYLKIAQAAVSADDSGPAGTPSEGSETILLVEDDEGVRRATRRLIESFGYTVLEASDGASAIALFEERKRDISLALIDVIMPKMNGKEVFDALRGIDPLIKVLFVSGYPEDVLNSKQLGEIACINKPVMPDELLTKMRNLLDQKP